MNFKKLLDKGKIEKIEKEKFSLINSEKDLETAKKNFDNEDYEWTVSITYNAVLRAVRKFMSYLGFRPIGKEHHKNAFEFLKESNFNKELTEYFDIIRKKRNIITYRDEYIVSKEEAEEVIKKTEDFVQEIRTFVQEIRTEKIK